MNITIFEKNKNTKPVEEMTLADEHALHIKQKIESRKNKQRRIKMIFAASAILIIFLLASTVYSQYKLHKLAAEEKGAFTASSTPKTGDEVIAALSRHILLPTGTPQIAEVQDASRLKDTQAFFKDAQNGDIVVVYATTIFIYRPSADIVVAAGDISGAGQIKP